jgi:hypothetical protein
VTFDVSGQYLGVAAGKAAKVFLAKEWSEVAAYTDARCVWLVLGVLGRVCGCCCWVLVVV